MQADEAIVKVKELLETNNGCKLPCFWGITPNQTSETDAMGILDVFSSVDYGSHSKESSSIKHFLDVNGKNNVGVHITFFTDKSVIGLIQASDLNSPSYHLPEFLIQNGKPDQIILRAWKRTPSNTDQVYFLVYMYYENSGMLVAYGMGTGTIEKDSINGCIDLSPTIQMWGVGKPQNIEDAMSQMGWTAADLLSISDATADALPVDSFYENFSRPNVKTCFSTSRNLWSEPDR